MSRTLSTTDDSKPRDWLHVAVQHLATQHEYDDKRIRDYLEQTTRREFVRYLHETDLSMIDAPVGCWEEQVFPEEIPTGEEPTDPPFPSHTWAYRLHGYAKAKEAQ